jgi:hypothetical protein
MKITGADRLAIIATRSLFGNGIFDFASLVLDSRARGDGRVGGAQDQLRIFEICRLLDWA